MNESPVSSLHILNKSPGHSRFSACIDAMAEGDVLLLTENAVVAVEDTSVPLPAATRALQADCLARGIQTDVTMIDYAGMVTLTEQFQRIISW